MTHYQCRLVALTVISFFLPDFSVRDAIAEPPHQLQPAVQSTSRKETVRELLRPAIISHEQGACFLARLAISRKADRESTSDCVLLEDGKPLAFPHALHQRIREQGKGHYSHWTPNTIYFSASDSSSPITNGRKYELVSSAEIIEKQSAFHLSAPDTLIQFPEFPERSVQPVKMVWRNLDPENSVTLNWKRKGAPDLTSLDAMLASILKSSMSAEEKSLAIWKFLIDWRYHFTPAEPGDELHDPVKFLNVYGYGFCDDCATNFAVLARKAGIKSRTWGLSGHVVAESFYNGKWHMFDPDHEVIYRNEQGEIAGVEELAQHPELITKTPRDPIGSPSKAIAQLYTTTHDNRPSERRPRIRETKLSPVLEPLDRVEFRFDRQELVHRKNAPDQAQPPVVGNGTLTRRMSQIKQLKQTAPNRREGKFDWPYVLLNGDLELQLKSNSPIPDVYVSNDARSWRKLEGQVKNETLTVPLEKWLHAQTTAVYQVYYRIENSNGIDPLETISRIDSKWIFQFAPRSLAHIGESNNQFEMKLVPSTDKPYKGVEVELRWKEKAAAGP